MLFEIIFLSVGILLIVSAVTKIFRNMRIKKKGIPVNATVVDIHRTNLASKNRSRTQYHSVFEYRVNDRLVRTQGPGELEVKYPIGTVSEIRYDPQKPDRILVGDQAVMGNVAPLLFGIIFAVGSVLSMVGVKLPKSGETAGYIVLVCLLLIFTIIYIFLKSLMGKRNEYARQSLSRHTANNVLVVAKKDNNTITFQFVNGNRIDYMVPESVYNDLREGDWGNLTFQGSLFIQFERTYRKQ